MPSTRSRQGCEECRRRRRKCDEQKPCCGQCSGFNRTCKYPLRLIWGNCRDQKTANVGQGMLQANQHALETDNAESSLIHHPNAIERQVSASMPRSLPNGVPLPRKYQKLMTYFVHDILASLSCHPSIHEDLRRGLVPVMLHSPQLMSACLALSAAGFLSRGISNVEGVEIPGILGHLQTSGLALLRSALGTGQSIDTLLATCLIWCLTDVFTYRQGVSSWRIHLQGMRALLDRNEVHHDFITPSSSLHSAMRHLHQLYLSLQTLPYLPTLEQPKSAVLLDAPALETPRWSSIASPDIDGFLGYSNELLNVLQQIDQLSSSSYHDEPRRLCEADILLGKVKGMISRDTTAPPDISICTPLSPEYNREFALCHQTFQQATLIHLYRQLYHLPSASREIQNAVEAIQEMVMNMIQGQPCHTWVAMSMPLFTLGCEAFTELQQSFVMDKIDKLHDCIGSLHVKSIRQALEDVWKLREKLGDKEGMLCSNRLLAGLQYNIILF